jgi:SAM-dependent methyltransferase
MQIEKTLKRSESSKNKLKGGKWDRFWALYKNKKQKNYLIKMLDLWLDISGILSKLLDNYIQNDQNYLFIELGCGGGDFIRYLKEKYNNIEFFGIDKSFIGCKIALEKYDNICHSNSIICGDIFQHPFLPEKFDIAFSFGLIEHFDHPEKVIKKHVDLLKPNGILVCIIPNLLGIQGKFFSMNVWKPKNKKIKKKGKWIWGMKYITIEELKKWLNSMKLKNIMVTPIGGIFPVFQLEAFSPVKKLSSRKIIYYFYRFFLFLPFIIINIPFLFRMNSISLSPYLIAYGVKK